MKKTWLALCLCAGLASGGCFPAGSPSSPAPAAHRNRQISDL